MSDLRASAPTACTGSNADIPPPVHAERRFKINPDFIDQRALESQWSSLLEQLETQILDEKDVEAVLRSGILRTDTGKAIVGLFVEAVMRSVGPLGSLDRARLKEIFEVLFRLEPDQWQAALGENFGFSGGKNYEGFKGFVQSILDRSSAQRDERIANNELLSDAHYEALKTLAKKGRQYIRSTDGNVDSALMMLEDARELRPSPKVAYAQLVTFIRQLEEEDVKRVRWSEHYVREVRALRDQVKPDDEVKPTWLEWMIGSSWWESLFDGPVKSSGSMNPSQAPVDGPNWLLSGLQRFERSADFYSNISTTGPRIPESFAGKLLYVCNALETFAALRLDSSQISAVRPAPVVAENSVRPDPEPNSDAWKNGGSDIAASPFVPTAGQPQTSNHTDPLVTLTQFIAKADELFTRNLVPWSTASAVDLEPNDVVIEMKELLRPVYQSTTAVLNDQPPVMEVVREQVQGFLERMVARLVSNGAAAWSSGGALVERNAGRAAGAFAAYMVVSNFYAYWFEPEPEDMVDPLQGLEPYPDAASDKESVIHEYLVEGLEDLFEEEPDFADEVKRLISESDYDDPADDPQLVENIGALLQQPVPSLRNMTYRDYVHEIALDASDQFEELDNGSTAPDEATAATNPVTTEAMAVVRSRRSADEYLESSKAGVSELNCAGLLIEAGQRALDAEISVQSGEQIAPGVTIDQGADKIFDAWMSLKTISDLQFFINSTIDKAVADSNLPKNLKSAFNVNTRINVEFRLRRGALEDHKPLYASRRTSFTLAELFAGQHEKYRKTREEIHVQWPAGCTAEFKNIVASNDFEALYKEKVHRVTSQPEMVELWVAVKKFELEETLGSYLNGTGQTEAGRNIANAYLNGHAMVGTIDIRSGFLSDVDHVVNAIHLTIPGSETGLFVFLGQNSTVIEQSIFLFDKGGRSIEEFPMLREALSRRITLKSFLSRDEDDFKFNQGKLEARSRPWWEKIVPDILFVTRKVKLPYRPIMIEWAMSVENDSFKKLYLRTVEKVLSDIDTVSSTKSERLTDTLLELCADSLAMFSMIAGPKGGAVAKGLALMFGLGSAGATFGRALVEDDPQRSDQHEASALRGAIFAVAGPYLGKLLGTTISNSLNSRITATVLQRLNSAGQIPAGVMKHLLKYKGVPEVVIHAARKIPKWISPVVKNPEKNISRMERKFRSIRTVKLLNRLKNGPEVAQKLMNKKSHVYFAGDKDGYVYKGFVMRGDARPPTEIFKDGFKLRTPITDVKQVNGMNGGFGGGKNALDPDGMGISTSAIYKDGGVGAFHYGGGRGGYTYVIDGRSMKGYDLYRNQNFASANPLKTGFRPLEINYGENIPGSKILGAYTPKGVFIPNPDALKSSIAASTPVPVVKNVALPLPLIRLVNNSTSSLNSPGPNFL
ncbi:hypothetical protein HNO86_06990 [Pseudomonas sp. C1C7]|uniref:hypothetical protein n=1 Tax=Pseudomonas sp. C1C7 TaxID=2735272 RepID=UPI001586B2A8|nr:hypothetical protein [Pseudomonas sp. C1C7]NUT74787.1 hypothetical protein [Pseudomonas sp. C1C7]